jgi:hypothetical protein
MRLYKYFRCSADSLDALKRSALWFSALTDFNDAFEGRFDFVSAYEVPEAEAGEVIEKFLVNYESLQPSDENREFIAKLARSGDHQQLLKVIFGVMQSAMQGSFSDLMGSDGVCCFSRGNVTAATNQLMWSHYADGLRGFCLAFDEIELERSLIEKNGLEDVWFMPVKYCSGFPVIHLHEYTRKYLGWTHTADGEAISVDYLGDLVTSKSRAWRYEREYRAVSPRRGLNYYSPAALRQVFLGERISDENKWKIRSIVDECDLRVELLQVKMDSRGYRLKAG